MRQWLYSRFTWTLVMYWLYLQGPWSWKYTTAELSVAKNCQRDCEDKTYTEDEIEPLLSRNEVFRSRKRRNSPGEEAGLPNVTQPYGNTVGLPVWPCDFEEGFCQWYQLSDSDFTWRRNRGATPSWHTGPSEDHTTGEGWYIFIETSNPQTLGNKARLVSSTLRPVNPANPCNISFFTHMRGRHIGQLNIHQAPIIGHDVIKLSVTSEQGSVWVKKEVVFDSDREFQIIVEGVRGVSYQGDIALDDISLSGGCQRIEPAFARLENGEAFTSGRVGVYNNGTWGQVCSEGWTDVDAQVICRELGFVKVNRTEVRVIDASSAGLVNLTCTGNEASISQCSNSSWESPLQCGNNQTAYLVCQGIAPMCPSLNHIRCTRQGNETLGKCISHGQLCDYHNDCWDGSDETNCENYTRCSFQDANLCGWTQMKNDDMDWIRHRGHTQTGPSSDHNGNASNYYIYIEVDSRIHGDKATLAVTPRFQGNHRGLCKVRFYYHMYGSATVLRVFLVDWLSNRPVWEKNYTPSGYWRRAEVTLLNTTRSFRVFFEATHMKHNNVRGDIAIDDVSFTPECKPVQENASCGDDTFKCPSGDCIRMDQRCDFVMDCLDGADELTCGDNTPGRCNFEKSFCDWTNLSDDQTNFVRTNESTLSLGTGPDYDHTLGMGHHGYFIYMEASYPRIQNDKAHLASPQFMFKGAIGCKVHFYYHMYSIYYGGTLRVKLKNVITSQIVTLKTISGDQGRRWIRASVPITTSWPVAQVILEAVRGVNYQSDIAIDDISFTPHCYQSEAVHVDKNYDVRLAGAKASYMGRVEVFRVGQWGTVCRDDWNTPDAHVVCRQLGYSGALANTPSYAPGKGQIWLDNLHCYGNETNVNECAHNGWAQHDCDHTMDVSAACNRDGGSTKAVRLTGPANNTRGGLVEIYHAGYWGLICFDQWDLHDAHVVCRQVGFSGIESITKESVAGSPIIHLSNVTCLGNESALDKCPHGGWGVARSCTYGYAGVVCKADGASEGDVRLSGGSSPKEGRVEIFHQGEWGTVCEDSWSEQNARVVCFQLGFTSVVNYHKGFGPGRGHVWLSYVRCYGNETTIASCKHTKWDNSVCWHRQDVGVVCSDDAYMGCYRDSDPRAMPSKAPTITALTPVKCMRYCQSKGFAYSGLEWSTECYCGDHYDKYGRLSDSKCASPCGGDRGKFCGGPFALSVYSSNPAILPSSAPGYPPVRQFCETRYVYRTRNYFSGTHTSGYITSPGYSTFPYRYPNGIRCVWALSVMPGTRARVEFVLFDTENKYDYVQIRDSAGTLTKESLSGNNLQTKVFEAVSNNMWIVFISDNWFRDRGFKLLYSAVGGAVTPTVPYVTVVPNIQLVLGGCNGRNHSEGMTFGYYDADHSTGYVQSPGYPSYSRGAQNCRWQIKVLPSYIVVVTVEDQLVSSHHYVKVFDGYQSVSSNTKRRAPWYFTSSGSFVNIEFVTSYYSRSKFKLTYRRAASSSTITTEITSATTPEKPGWTTPPYGKKGQQGLSSGEKAGVAFGVLIPIILIIIVLLLFIKYKKRKNNQGVRHTFVNEAYDDDAMTMSDPRPNGTAVTAPPPVETPAVPSVFYACAIAPPPYSATAPTGIYFVPTSQNGAVPNTQQYANLYATPPPYQANGDPPGRTTAPTTTHTTTTAIGSVTSLRDNVNDNAPLASSGINQRHTSSLPPIRGALTGMAAVDSMPTVDENAFMKVPLPSIPGASPNEAKNPLPQDQAGPLPEKVPLSNDPPPLQPPSAAPSMRTVSPSPSGLSFDVDVPFEFICPITNEIMKQPVSAADGYTYERRAIKSWLRRNPTSPMTNEPITDLTLRPNDHLRERIEEFVSTHSSEFTPV